MFGLRFAPGAIHPQARKPGIFWRGYKNTISKTTRSTTLKAKQIKHSLQHIGLPQPSCLLATSWITERKYPYSFSNRSSYSRRNLSK